MLSSTNHTMNTKKLVLWFLVHGILKVHAHKKLPIILSPNCRSNFMIDDPSISEVGSLHHKVSNHKNEIAHWFFIFYDLKIRSKALGLLLLRKLYIAYIFWVTLQANCLILQVTFNNHFNRSYPKFAEIWQKEDNFTRIKVNYLFLFK